MNPGPCNRTFRGLAAWAVGAVLLAPVPAWAQVKGYDLTSAALKMVGVLALVLGLLIGLLYLLKRLSPRLSKRTAVGREMDLLAQYPLGPKRFLAVVRLGEQILLLGVTETSINLITEVTDPEMKERLLSKETSAAQGFSHILKKAGQRFKEGPEQ